MKTNQIYDLLNGMSKEITGMKDLTVKDTASFISFGKKVFDSDTTTDQCYKALVDRIGLTICRYKELRKKDLIEKLDTITFGGAIHVIETTGLADAGKNLSWITGASGELESQDPFTAVRKDGTKIISQIFSKRGTWEVDKKVYDIQLRTAFTNESQMSAFVEMIFADMYNAMTNNENSLQHAVLSASIASAINYGSNPENNNNEMARNLLHEYNTLTNASLTVSNALSNKDFLKFCAKEILLATKQMTDPSVAYNEFGATRWSDSPSVYALSAYTTASDAYLSADTYHKELVALPDYREVNFWQAIGDGTFDDRSEVNVYVYANDDTDEEGTEVAKNGILAFVCDAHRQGYIFDNIRTKSIYNPASECTDYFHKADQGFYINRTHNAIVFYMAEA